MRGASGKESGFLPLPILASVMFIVLAVGEDYQTTTGIGRYIEAEYGPIPDVATAWMRMQVQPQNPDEYGWMVAKDTIALMIPVSPAGHDSPQVYTVYFMSLQGVPFRYYYYSWYSPSPADLHAGARVFAGFTFSPYSGWYLSGVVSVNAVG